jgi:hypothetical protein
MTAPPQIYSSKFAVALFAHRIGFIIARAIAIIGVPTLFLWVGGAINDDGFSILWLLKVVAGIILPLVPIILFKTVIRVTCPSCGEKLDREVVGAGNYDCKNCEASFS